MFEHLCKEKGGPVWRAVWMPAPTIDWATRTIEKMTGIESFLPKDNPYALLLNPQNKFFQVDDVGIIAILPSFEWPELLHTHITFWDKRLRGREGLCKSLAALVSQLTGKYLFTQIPTDRRALLAFAYRVGFQPQADIGPSKTLLFTNYTE